MRELFRPSPVLPALLLAEIAMPFSVIMARTVYWEAHHPDASLVVSIGLVLVLIMYVVIEGIRHASLIAGAIVGLWAPIVGFWPSFIVESATRNAMELSWAGVNWTGILDMVPRMLEFAAGGLVFGLVVSLAPWLIHRRHPKPEQPDRSPHPTGWLLVATVVFAILPLLAALGLSRRVDWVMQQYATGKTWAAAAQMYFWVETASRIALLALAVAATFLFFARRPAVRPLGIALLGIAVAAAALRIASAPHLPLPGGTGWHEFQAVLDVADVASAVLAAGLGIPYLLRSQKLRAIWSVG
jgi:hypothetical protein